MEDHASLVLQLLTAGMVAITAYFNYMKSKQNGEKIDEVHKLANGTTSALTTALQTEQQKNTILTETVAKTVPALIPRDQNTRVGESGATTPQP